MSEKKTNRPISETLSPGRVYSKVSFLLFSASIHSHCHSWHFAN